MGTILLIILIILLLGALPTVLMAFAAGVILDAVIEIADRGKAR